MSSGAALAAPTDLIASRDNRLISEVLIFKAHNVFLVFQYCLFDDHETLAMFALIYRLLLSW